MKKHRLLPYRQAIPAILLFQMIATAVLQLWMLAFSALSRLLLASAGRVAVTSGDLTFLFTSWQGYLLLLLALVTLFLYVAIDVNALIILCGRLLRGEKPQVLRCIKEGFFSLRRFLGLRGVAVVLYIALLSPILGFGVTISLTADFYIPTFITSAIFSNPLYTVGLIAVLLALLTVGVLFVFLLHGTLLRQYSLKQAARRSLHLVRKNLRNYLFEMLRFTLIQGAIVIALLAFVTLLESPLLPALGLPEQVLQVWGTLLVCIALSMMLLLYMFFTPFFALKLTQLYYRYESEGEWTYQPRKKRKSPVVIITAGVLVLLIGIITLGAAFFPETLAHEKVHAGIIAHRAGGREAPENTAAGIDAAVRYGAVGSETDIQRTRDGYYIINHDDTFARTAGVNKKPSEMTLQEVKALRVDGEPVPTLGEMLDKSRDRVMLLIELKGATADRRMADDAVSLLREKDMVGQAMLISLQYDLIEYIEDKYPEITTGYLAFASFGDTAALYCDCLALEEETATETTIDSIHALGKQVYVWTVDEESEIERFLLSDADGIITDNLSAAAEITRELNDRPLYQNIMSNLKNRFLPDR